MYQSDKYSIRSSLTVWPKPMTLSPSSGFNENCTSQPTFQKVVSPQLKRYVLVSPGITSINCCYKYKWENAIKTNKCTMYEIKTHHLYSKNVQETGGRSKYLSKNWWKRWAVLSSTALQRDQRDVRENACIERLQRAVLSSGYIGRGARVLWNGKAFSSFSYWLILAVVKLTCINHIG